MFGNIHLVIWGQVVKETKNEVFILVDNDPDRESYSFEICVGYSDKIEEKSEFLFFGKTIKVKKMNRK